MKKTIYTGSAVAVVTPMNEEGSVDYDVLGALIDWQIDNGTDAIVICGTTGESTTMTDDEHVEVMAYAIERTAGRVPLIAGCGSNDTAYAIWLSEEAKMLGADALLHVTPYYNKTTQAGIIKHFNVIADATDLPVILYNVPSRTGLDIKPETYRELCKHPNIVATKEANGNISSVAQTRYLCGDELDIYSGNDDQIVPLMSLGGKGVISVLANIMPRETRDICHLYLDGRTDEAAALQIQLITLIDSLFTEVNPIPVKEALNLMGRKAGPCRLPLTDIGAAAKARLEAELKAHKLI